MVMVSEPKEESLNWDGDIGNRDTEEVKVAELRDKMWRTKERKKKKQ